MSDCIIIPSTDPQRVIDGLLLWGWNLLDRAEKLGSFTLLSSGILEVLAAEGHRPPEDWTGPVFKVCADPELDLICGLYRLYLTCVRYVSTDFSAALKPSSSTKAL